MPNLLDPQYFSNTDGMESNCLKNIIDQNLNTDEENNTCQLIKHRERERERENTFIRHN